MGNLRWLPACFVLQSIIADGAGESSETSAMDNPLAPHKLDNKLDDAVSSDAADYT